MKRSTRTILIVIGAAVVLAVLVIANLRRPDTGTAVQVAVTGPGSIRSVVSATGELRALNQVNIQAQVMGVIERLPVAEGDLVRRGDLLLRLDRSQYEAGLVQARARFTQARLSHTRVESLYARNLVSGEQHEASLAALEMAEAQFRQAEDQYDKTSIRAPIAGTVARVNVREGETVMLGTMNNPGTVVMVLADMSRMQALVNADETDIVSLQVGQAAEVEVDALPDTTFRGRVTRIGYMPAASLSLAGTEGTDFEVEITLDTLIPALRPGMSAAAEIVTAELEDVLVVPIQALGRREVEGRERETVFVIAEGRAELRPVRTGRSSDTHIQVTEGLAQGDTLITGPYKLLSRLRPGRRVRPQQNADRDHDAAGK
ncbi:MAG TPA: efflux RND transporter periplasmic adaptor subunit [candidate division WOR-3 bacterium]|uniref:Efflux RND transporter periplasmic adaptor subunit n=1 Tax=candidate division WOR-3 bacterium TaxID=2052148 RepID=A0A7V0XET7_UNCW3|nr:efflux RND transporter periplasmic adaptor subunit [candidate division WOR-3 bacterium]